MGGLRISRVTKKDSIAPVEDPQVTPAEAEPARSSDPPVRRTRRSLQDRQNARARFNAEAAGRRPKIVEIDGTRGDDRISVRRQKDGRIRVEQNGEVQTYDRNTQLFIKAGDGDDRVRVRGNVDVEVD